MFSNDRMARRLARGMLAAAFLFGGIPMLVVVADESVAHAIVACSLRDNCYDGYESMMQRCAGLPQDARKRCQRAAAEQLAECKKKDQDYRGGGGRF